MKFLLALLLSAAILQVAVSQILKTKYYGSMNDKSILSQYQKSANGAADEQWFTQKLDHFNPLNAGKTWQQRYFINDTNWDKKNNGPIFVVLGGEGPISAGYVSDRFATGLYAKMFGALVVGVEHRFYGKSNPLSTLDVESLQYLTTEQALADYALFIQAILDKFDAHHSKVITVGGSYPGSLSAWMRLKYPHLVFAAIAASAPVKAQTDFSAYMEVVADALGSSCNAKLREATDQIEQYLASDQLRSKLTDMFGACSPVSTNDDDQTVFVSALSDPVCEIVQYNNDNNRFQFFNITRLCSILQDPSKTSSIQAFADFVKVYSKEAGLSCIESSYDKYLSDLQNTGVQEVNDNAAGRSWTWQYCNEYGYLQAAVGKRQPFSNKITLDWFVKTCRRVFNIKDMTPNPEYINTIFGSDQPRGSRIIFSNGSIDPWHYLGVLSRIPPTQEAYFMQGTAHCADLYSPRDSDLTTLKFTRQEQVRLLKYWMETESQ